MTTNRDTSLGRTIAGCVLIAFGGAWLLLLASECWPIVVTRDKAKVAEYHFGSEAMTGDGGWSYSNPELYAWSALALGLMGFAACGLAGTAILRRSWRPALVAVLVCLAYWATVTESSAIDWERRDFLSTRAGHESWACRLPLMRCQTQNKS